MLIKTFFARAKKVGKETRGCPDAMGSLRRRASIWPARSGHKHQRSILSLREALGSSEPALRAPAAALAVLSSACRCAQLFRWCLCPERAGQIEARLQAINPCRTSTCFFAYFLCTSKESRSPAGARPGTRRVSRLTRIAAALADSLPRDRAQRPHGRGPGAIQGDGVWSRPSVEAASSRGGGSGRAGSRSPWPWRPSRRRLSRSRSRNCHQRERQRAAEDEHDLDHDQRQVLEQALAQPGRSGRLSAAPVRALEQLEHPQRALVEGAFGSAGRWWRRRPGTAPPAIGAGPWRCPMSTGWPGAKTAAPARLPSAGPACARAAPRCGEAPSRAPSRRARGRSRRTPGARAWIAGRQSRGRPATPHSARA